MAPGSEMEVIWGTSILDFMKQLVALFIPYNDNLQSVIKRQNN